MDTSSVTENAAEIQRLYGSNYYAASLLFPKHIRERVVIFYAFVRLADEAVDNPKNDARSELQTFIATWQKVSAGDSSEHFIINAFYDVCREANVPLAYVTEFLEAMEQDLDKSRYETYEDLQAYMRGSAEVIGLILLRLFECDNKEATRPAEVMGEAMQLTNFLRDVYEDYFERDRIYLPREDMKKFGVSETMLVERPSNEAVQSLIKFEVERAHQLYTEAKAGIALLPASVRPAVKAAAALCEEVLHELKSRGYGVQTKKISFSKIKKLKIAVLYGYVKK